MEFIISSAIKRKLREKHNVQPHEVEECFANRVKHFLKDTREEHDTDPPTLWFVAETDYGRKLKVCFINKNKKIFIKTAYLANENEIKIYERHA